MAWHRVMKGPRFFELYFFLHDTNYRINGVESNENEGILQHYGNIRKEKENS
ncbi:uncharacterized protein G2W53_028071 [Senna tora]|uniref:Uncharacterized protein n=1 Tax=Senna tora TaxID=362788 RepID=A0A834W9F7_9FABA|nr:uncharacterized protein G2W53_028071 [Senna tora]